MKKFAVSLFALAAISGAAFAANGADNNAPAFDYTPSKAGSADTSALSTMGSIDKSDKPHYINGNQLR
jgi:hypothetical protein